MIKRFQPGWLALGLMLSVLSSRTCTAQENYLPGYILSLQGDTLKGLIDYRNWKINPKKVDFKTSEHSDIQSYSALEITGFRVADEVYKGAVFDTEQSHYGTDLNFNKELIIRKDTAFLQMLLDGPKSLYYFNGYLIPEQFYILRDGQFELLAYKRYLKKTLGKSTIAENMKFTGQLIHYLQDCPSIVDYARNLKYIRSDIEKLFAKYYNCTNQQITFQKVEEKFIWKPGVVAGISFYTVEFNSEQQISKTEFSNSINFTGGLSVDILIPRSRRKWSVYNDLVYTSYHVEGTYPSPTETGPDILYTFEYSHIKLSNMIRYSTPDRPTCIFFNSGISQSMAISGENSKKYVFPVSGDVIDNGPNTKIRKFERKWILGMGVKSGRFSLEVRGELLPGKSKAFRISSEPTRLFMLLGYRL